MAACALLGVGAALPMHAAEHITLRNGFDLICDHRVAAGDHVRLYLAPAATSFMEVAAADIVSSEQVDLPPATPSAPDAIAAGTAAANPVSDRRPPAQLTRTQIRQMAATAGAAHDLDVELLASVIHAESDGNVRAVSRAGARGLMQLMPETASELGVADSFRAEQNIEGGTAYLDTLLKRYNDNLALALAAYNAGPATVDRYHGIPPYAETRRYVARIIHDFNRRKAQGITTLAHTLMATAAQPGQ